MPTVYAFVGGQPVTASPGAQPESQIKALVERLLGGAVDEEATADLEAAHAAAEAGDTTTAAAIYNALLREDPANAEAIGGLARCLVTAGKLKEAASCSARTPRTAASHAAVVGARAALELAEESGDLGDPKALAKRLDADEDDHDARYRMATILFLRGQAEVAMEQLCRIVRRDRAWRTTRPASRWSRFFEALGPKHAATLKGRRMLSAVLFS